jgi:hypothetical protein
MRGEVPASHGFGNARQKIHSPSQTDLPDVLVSNGVAMLFHLRFAQFKTQHVGRNRRSANQRFCSEAELIAMNTYKKEVWGYPADFGVLQHD